MVVDEDEEEEGAYVYPITCAELLNEEFNASKEGKIRTLWTPGHVVDLRGRVKIDEDQS